MSRVSGTAERIRVAILRGDVPAGGRVVELHLVETLRASRPTVRAALRRPEGDGLLVADHDGGMRVVALDRHEVAQTLEVRAALEALAAGLAAGGVRDGELDPGAVRAVAGVEEDRAFHRALTALAGSRPCQDALARVWDRLVVAGAPAAPAREHAELVAAIATGDAEAASAVARRHVVAPAL